MTRRYHKALTLSWIYSRPVADVFILNIQASLPPISILLYVVMIAVINDSVTINHVECTITYYYHHSNGQGGPWTGGDH
jgi:hypothetical protein